MKNSLLSNGVVTNEHTRPNVKGIAIFRLAFRPFFLFASLFSILCLLAWYGFISGKLNANVYGDSLWWHMHEMLFGFVSAIVAGFLLTAVQTWTGLPSLKGVSLMLLFSLWLAGRIFMWLPTIIPGELIVATDLLFLPTVALCMANLVIRAKMWRNLIFVPVLLAMTFVNAAMHCAVWIHRPDIALNSAISMTLLVTLIMTIIGGRVFPMFTANGTGTTKVPPLAWLEKATIASMLLVIATQSGWLILPVWLSASILFVATALQALRVFRWRIWVTFKTPLVWTLHMSYWCIPLGLLLLGLSQITRLVSVSQAIHSFTVGGMGLMILSMISRVSLGHTGRLIQVGRVMLCAFVFLSLAFLVRVFGGTLFANYLDLLLTATLFWAIAYGMFFVMYLPILTAPRPDGRPG